MLGIIIILSMNGKEYLVKKLLGKGKSGYSYLVSDEKDKQYVIKVIHHEPVDYYTFGDKFAAELAAYKKLLKIGIRMPKLISIDYAQERILKEYIEGPTIMKLIENDSLPKAAFKQIDDMIALLYPANTNIDYFPTNFVWNKQLLYYVDYECNDYMEQWDFENWGKKYWSKTKIT